MGVELNWGLLQPPANVGQSALSGFQQGLGIQQQAQQQRQQQAVQSALAGYGSDPDGAINSLIQAGAVQQASALSALRQQQQDRAADKATGATIAAAYNPDGTINTAKLAGAAQSAFATQGAKAGQIIADHVATLTTQQRQQAKDAASAAGVVAATAQGLDGGEAAQRAYVQSNRAELISQGVPASQIDSLLATPQGQFGTALQGVIGHAQSVSDILSGQQHDEDQAEKVREFNQGQLTTRRGQDLTARAAAARTAVAASQAATSRMSYEARKAAGGFGTPGVGSEAGGGTDDEPPE